MEGVCVQTSYTQGQVTMRAWIVGSLEHVSSTSTRTWIGSASAASSVRTGMSNKVFLASISPDSFDVERQRQKKEYA